MLRITTLLLILTSALSVAAEQVLLPGVTALAYGSSSSVWSSEVRVTNLSDSDKQISVVDWIGTAGWRPKTWTVPAHHSLSIGGFDVLNDKWYWLEHWGAIQFPAFGAAIADLDPGLIAQVAVLTGVVVPASTGTYVPCEPWNGGYIGMGGVVSPCLTAGPCDTGSGPIIDATDFFAAGSTVLVPWLNSDEDRRTNIVYINPDPTTASVAVSIFAADGTTQATQSVQVPSHSILQVNDVFAGTLSAVRTYNSSLPATAARLTAQSNTRLYVLAYVVSNLNNTVSASLPRLLP